MSTDAQIVGKRIRRLREARGWSQRELSREINVNRSPIANWETGRSMPCLQNRKALADKFKVPSEILFGIGEEIDEALEEAANALALAVTRNEKATNQERVRASQELKKRRASPRNTAKAELTQFRRMMEDAHVRFRQLVAEIEARESQNSGSEI